MSDAQDNAFRLDPSVQSADEVAFVSYLDENMVGQPQAKMVARRIYRAIHNPFREPDRPIFSAIFAGESRRGKNHLVRLLARWFHGHDRSLVKVNGGEFMERHNLARLIGAPHGYIGFSEDGGRRGKKDSSAILSQHNLDLSHDRSAYDVAFVLFDEWEKMHYVVINLLLAGLDEGEFTISNNTDVNFRNVVLLMTSNMGMDEVQRRMRQIGFFKNGRKATSKDIGSAVTNAYREKTSPEFRNRIDEVVVFEPFSNDELLQIVGMEFRNLNGRIAHQASDGAFRLDAEMSAQKLLLAMAQARDDEELANLKRIMNHSIVDPLAIWYRQGHIGRDDIVVVKEEGGKLVFERNSASTSREPARVLMPVAPQPARQEKPDDRTDSFIRAPQVPPRKRVVFVESLPDHLL